MQLVVNPALNMSVIELTELNPEVVSTFDKKTFCDIANYFELTAKFILGMKKRKVVTSFHDNFVHQSSKLVRLKQ